MPRIGVEQSLTAVQEELKEKGYDVVQLKTEQDAQGCDCCVITGQDQNVMGMSDTTIQGAVIRANGMSAQEVCQEVEERLQNQEQ
ncbi:YkuS family protein [Halalkalibacterium ligniniphilum]|uniref:YkuS family protein n=1 Tax=Halalkalibacterium ligniniphilum TaxID=1134413 RepID=UPI000348C763|nr:YkuS family protein [Halalkalibacterium ligniniphilum]